MNKFGDYIKSTDLERFFFSSTARMVLRICVLPIRYIFFPPPAFLGFLRYRRFGLAKTVRINCDRWGEEKAYYENYKKKKSLLFDGDTHRFKNSKLLKHIFCSFGNGCNLRLIQRWGNAHIEKRYIVVTLFPR